ncbi:MAG: FCD domain-containing protein [Propionibacteriaceae bacterium]|nr:FCD domain-containing protein [Propionibacteriaceae bacterium]
MRPSLVHVVTEQILDRIAQSEFPPGSVLPSEGDLAKLMGASRPTCREAVRILCTQEVLRSVQGRGTFVNPVRRWISLDAILRMHDANLLDAMIQLIEVRTLIEVGAAELFAPLCREEHLELMESDLEAMRSTHMAEDVVAFVSADMAFHHRVLEGCGNPFITATFRPITSALQEGRIQTSSVPEIRTNAIAEHANIIVALRTGSSERAGAAMRSHLEQTRRDAARHLVPLRRSA